MAAPRRFAGGTSRFLAVGSSWGNLPVSPDPFPWSAATDRRFAPVRFADRRLHRLPQQDDGAGSGERDRDEEEQEAGGERAVRVHVQVSEEADEEGLADGDAVDREWEQQDHEQ